MSNTNKKVNYSNNSLKKNATKTYNKIKKLSLPLRMLIIFVLLLVVGLIIYFIYKAIRAATIGDSENPLIIPGAVDASDPGSSMSVTLPNTSGSNSPTMAFSLSFWIYVSDWYYRLGEPKAIMIKARGNQISSAAPGIWLAPNRNNLIITTAVLGNKNGGKPQSCNIPNIPLQKWVHIAYVLDNRTNDVYVNGKLERSCVLRNVPRLNNANLRVLPKTNYKNVGFLGQLAGLRYFSSALRPSDVVKIYNDGPHVTDGQKATGDVDPNDEEGGQCTVNTAKKIDEMNDQLKTMGDEMSALYNEVSNDTCSLPDKPSCIPPCLVPGTCPTGSKWCPLLNTPRCVKDENYKTVCVLNCSNRGGKCKGQPSLCADSPGCE